jgi:hypothetical protein
MKQLSAIIHHRSKNRTTPFPNFRHRLRDRPNLWVYCYQHRLWNLHGLAPKCEVAEPDGTLFILDESEPGTITGPKPHHDHAGEFWIECRGYAPLDIRRKISARKPPTETKEIRETCEEMKQG